MLAHSSSGDMQSDGPEVATKRQSSRYSSGHPVETQYAGAYQDNPGFTEKAQRQRGAVDLHEMEHDEAHFDERHHDGRARRDPQIRRAEAVHRFPGKTRAEKEQQPNAG